MKVRSPIGDYPYVARKLGFRRGRLVVEGALGVWETTFEVEPRDWLELGRRLAVPIGAAAAIGIVARHLRDS